VGELAAVALKFGIAALPAILSEYGMFAAFFAFFAFMPLGHTTIGVLFVVIGLFFPRMPAPGDAEQLQLAAGHATLNAKGSTRTILIGIGALIIVLSLVVEPLLR